MAKPINWDAYNRFVRKKRGLSEAEPKPKEVEVAAPETTQHVFPIGEDHGR